MCSVWQETTKIRPLARVPTIGLFAAILPGVGRPVITCTRELGPDSAARIEPGYL
jgi:hypothetical protein